MDTSLPLYFGGSRDSDPAIAQTPFCNLSSETLDVVFPPASTQHSPAPKHPLHQ